MVQEVSTFWSLIVVAGFLGWIGSVISFIFRAIDENDHLINRRAIFWGSLTILFYALWVIGLVNA